MAEYPPDQNIRQLVLPILLADVLARIPGLKTNQLEPLLLANWKPSVPNSA